MDMEISSTGVQTASRLLEKVLDLPTRQRTLLVSDFLNIQRKQ